MSDLTGRELHRSRLLKGGLREDEADLILREGRCGKCGHLEALHNYHCCEFCTVDDCGCDPREFTPITDEDRAALAMQAAERDSREAMKQAERIAALGETNRKRAEVGLPPINAKGERYERLTPDGLVRDTNGGSGYN